MSSNLDEAIRKGLKAAEGIGARFTLDTMNNELTEKYENKIPTFEEQIKIIGMPVRPDCTSIFCI